MIDYSLAARPSIPSDKNSEKKVYPHAQAREVLTLNKFARHIAEHGSPYTRDIILGVITAMVDCLREQLLLGNKVQVGEMGSFYVTLSCNGTQEATTFNPASDIKRVNVRWDRGKNFDDLKQEAEFNYVTNRKEQAQAKKQEKQALDETVGNSGNTSPGDGTGNGDSGDPGDIVG